MYDNNGNELSQEEINRMQNEARLKSGLRKMAGDFSRGFRDGAGLNKKDVDNIKDRKGKNEGLGRPKDEDEDSKNEKTKDKSSLEEKEGLEKKDKKDKKDSKDSKGDNKKDKKDKKSLTDKKEGFLKSKWSKLLLKVKIALIAAGAFFVVAIIVIISSAIMIAIDAFKNAITNFFGISDKSTEVDGKEIDGLYSDKYLYDDQGNPLNAEDLVINLKSTDKCGGTNIISRVWNNAGDAITNFLGIEGMSVCKFMREIKRQTDGTDLDRSLIISTIFYGYATQASNSQYNNASDVPDDKIDATNQYEILEAVLKDTKNGLTKSDFDDIIKYMKAGSSYSRYYYTWEIDDSEDGKLVGKCEKHDVESGQYSLDKWKVFMRFGSHAADKFDEANMLSYAYNSSDEECVGQFTEDELKERIENSLSEGETADISLDSSVTNAINELKDTDGGLMSAFYQHAEINTKTKDVFTSYEDVTFDYKNGFAYTHFPGYQKADNDPKINQSYDDIFTPKYVETTIQEIISKKKDLNSVLLFEDPDSPDDFITNRGSSVNGGRCGDYISSSYDEMQVRLTDCHGKEMKTVSFEDYIIGVANGEVSNTGDNYVLSQMLAAISYALKRHNNYTKGSLITMRSGTCDQVYCSMMEGCYPVANPDVCEHCSSYYIGGSKKYPQLYSKYQAYYEQAIAYLVVSNGMPHNAHYTSTNQNRWKEKSNQGMVFTQIIQEEYQDEGAEVIKCSDLNSSVETPEVAGEEEKVGNVKTDEYPNVSGDLGNFYGFAYKEIGNDNRIEINPDWVNANLTTIKPTCSDTTFANMEFTVHKKAVDAYQKAFDGVCKLITEGVTISNGDTCKYTVNDLKDGGTFIARKTTSEVIDIHSYGIAQDWNYSQKYTINGKEFSPYNTRELSDYLDFVNEIGGEENCQNINYILWLKAYKDAGFEWGGNFGRNGNSGEYDGKLFYIKYE